jgi:CheY-like chemotaxis protein
MPEMDGYEATRKIRELDGLQTTPIVALTADALDGSRELSLAAGMNDHLTKPLSLRVLTAKLVEWLGRGSSEERKVETAKGAASVR